MARLSKTNVSALVRELRSDISELESELDDKKDVLNALEKLTGVKGRKASSNGRRRRRGSSPVRRKSKNRDILIAASSAFKDTFSLQELIKKIRVKHPGFGGKYPASTLITVIRTTPEVYKVSRGQYKYKG